MASEISSCESSIFEHKDIEEFCQEIQNLYLRDNRPWIIGYSGGKDSTATLQLIWHALAKLAPEKREKRVYVVSSDTLVENPVMMDYLNNSLQKINDASIQQKMPFQVIAVKPEIEDSFWVNLIGKGYPAPSKSFRWCTERLKIRPTNRFILDQVAEYGEVIIVLGVRKSESANREQTINLHKINDSPLSRHTHLPQAYVYTPIEDFNVNDVWDFLLNKESPWGVDNRDLLTLYEDASAAESPFVIDDTTPPAGNSRFGCWVCTVVTKDKTMESLIEKGEDWLKPLNELRDFLSETQILENKPKFRDYRRMNGKIQFKKDKDGNAIPGQFIYGPYKFEICKEILRKLLKAQKEIRKIKSGSKYNLILPEELHEIRRIWQMEKGDWGDSLPKIYKEITGTDLDWIKDDLGMFTKKDQKILEEICLKHEIPLRLVSKLLEAERQVQGMSRRSSVHSKIESILSEDWHTKEEASQKAKENQKY
ncbi:DNA phosphorothioation system sulfurtransferase DndC [Methanosarcina mazei]|uniref:DNA phosphorothioation system sulfurtransferase DndC n=1 Tax=Methanosarcina mazei TaxID=2209 RepID=UPI0006796F97|nr:DNA phosphorothioation system sulfurtransferase DndC [Methanosarcina mazei]